MVRKKIIWEPWKDFLKELVENNSDEDEDRPYRDSYEKKGNVGPVLVGPMGIIPINESNCPSKVFTFLMGHTNFDIDEETKNKICDTPGVETFDLFTRYRFRISVGKAFSVKEVCRAIDRTFLPKKKRKNIDKIDVMKSHLKKKYTYWAIIVLPTGELSVIGDKSKEVVIKRIQERKEEAKEVIASWESE